jgi:integrase
LNSIDTYTTESFTRFLKIEQQYPDNYCGQLLKLLKIILRGAEKSVLEMHPYSNYIASFKQKSLDRILHILNPQEIKALKELQHVPEEFTDSYRWLFISLCIGQRVSDNLKLRPNTLRKTSSGWYIDILKQMKVLCRMAEINDLVFGFKNNLKTRRKEIIKAPKDAFVTSHIMRRSFVSN